LAKVQIRHKFHRRLTSGYLSGSLWPTVSHTLSVRCPV